MLNIIMDVKHGFLILFVLAMAAHPGGKVIAQDTTFVEGAIGVGVISGRVTAQDAEREALQRAKTEALRMAGITEHISSYEMMFRSEINFDYMDVFSSDIQSELQGAVTNYEIVNHVNRIHSISGLPEVEITINASVIRHDTRPDPAFSVNITGIKRVYGHGELLNFSVYATQDAYLNIFNINDHEATLLYPNQWEQRRRIPGDQATDFPFGNVLYHLEKQTGQAELNRLFFVFTKTPVSFLNHHGEAQFTTAEEIYSWAFSIPPDIRITTFKTYTIR